MKKGLDNGPAGLPPRPLLVFADRTATYTSTMVQRLADDGGAVLAG